jgi:carbonic anhydrase
VNAAAAARSLVQVAALLALGMNQFAHAESAHWGYEGKTGPQSWGDLGGSCRSGKGQSPIDISRVGQTAAKPKSLPNLLFRWKQSKAEVINNGHTLQVNVERGNETRVGSDRYELSQFHFHIPSEHRFDGRNAPMEVHFVHRGSNGKQLVVGMMIQVAGKNEPLAPVFLKPPRTTSMRRQLPIDLSKIAPVGHAYYSYEGSLTTPPCSEGVHWVLLKESISISSNQYKVFKTMFGNNARPPQPLNGREVAVTE